MKRKMVFISMILFSLKIFAQTWEKINMSFPEGDTLLSSSSISLTTKNIGWIFTSGAIDTNRPPNQYSTKILKTTDGGHKWTLQKYVSDSFDPHSLFTIDSLHCWAINRNGDLLFTTDGGSKWETSKITSGQNSYPFSAIYFFNDTEGIAINDTHPWFTNDGGKSWNVGDSSLIYLTISDITFVGKDKGWIVSSVTPYATDAGYIANSTNGGRTWKYNDTLRTSPIMYGVDFVDSVKGFAVGTNWNFSTGFICSTTDGGNVWLWKQFIGSKTFWDIGFIDTKNGWITGSGKILRTTDGGETWENQVQGIQSELRKLIILKKDKVAYVFGDNHYQAPFTLLYASLSDLTQVNHSEENIPREFYLAQNYPNPFNSETIIEYSINHSSFVQLKVFNILGKEVRTLVREYKNPGLYKVIWDGKNNIGGELTSGVYIYQLNINFKAERKKLIMLK